MKDKFKKKFQYLKLWTIRAPIIYLLWNEESSQYAVIIYMYNKYISAIKPPTALHC